MLIRLHTGPKSSPKLALFDTTGLCVVASETPRYPSTRPEKPRDPHTHSHDRREERPDPTWDRYNEARGGKRDFAADLADWERRLAQEQASWDTYAARHADERYQNALVWIGQRFVSADGSADDVATPVHETVEEIARLAGLDEEGA